MSDCMWPEIPMDKEKKKSNKIIQTSTDEET